MSEPLLTGVHELGPEPAISVGGRGLSYGELREVAAALAAQLEGVERVAVWAESTLEACVASIAAVCAGIPLVPVNPKLGRGELEHVLSDSRPDAIVGAPDGELPELEHTPRRLSVDLDARGGELPAVDAGDEDAALDHLHLRHDRPAEGGDPAAARRRLEPRRARRRLGMDGRGHPRARPPLVPRARAGARPLRAAAARR